MAISGGDGSIILTTKVDESGLKKDLGSMGKTAKSFGAGVAKSFAVIGAAAAAATVAITKMAVSAYADTVAITKMAVSAYADYEQLVGGVETLFKGSAQKVIDYANDAFFTAGVSANEYMQQVTSFSASLISSTAGDTEKAADIANMALIDISDNVNKMGSSMESVTLAYQGFAKQQYMLLDNLKLGYGGTKGEMERLLKGAQALTGVKYDINNLADVYSAIHAIQENLGITGTTAKEAEKTITGSANMMKVAWQNVLSAIAGGGDLDRAINNLVYSVQKYFENIVPVVQRSLVGIGQLIEKVAPMLVQNVASALIQSIPSLINAIYQMIIGLAKGIYQGVKALFTGGSGSVTAEIKTSVGGIAAEAGNASTAIEGLGDATEKAGKQAKKSLAPFDNLDILPSGGSSEETQAPEISIGGTNGSAVTIDTSSLGEAEKEVGGFASAIQEQFANIGESIKNVWDSEPVQSFAGAVSSYGLFVGNYWASLGGSMWQNAQTTWGNIEGDFSTMTSNMTNFWTTFWQDVQVAIDTWGQPIIDGITGLFDSVWTTAIDPLYQLIVQTWTDFTQIISELWEEYGAPLLDAIGEFATNAIAYFQSIYDNVISPIITPLLETLSELWDTKLKGIIKKIGAFVMKLITAALNIYNNFIFPIYQWIMEKLAPVFSFIGQYISIIVSNLVGTIVDFVSNIIDGLSSLIDFVVNVFEGDWDAAWQSISDFFSSIWEAIKSVWEGIQTTFEEGWQLISDTLNLEEIWEDIKDFWNEHIAKYFTKKWWQDLAKDIGNGLIDGFESAANSVINIFEKMVNWIVDALNTISFDVPDWVPGIGGEKFGFNIPKVDFKDISIPRLAQGTVVPPNRRFLAELGDNTKEHEIVSPLSTMKQAVTEAMLEIGGKGQIVKEEHYYLSETELMAILHKLVKGGERLQGPSLISGGWR